MKKLGIIVAAVGLMSVAACGSSTPAENAADNAVEAIENMTDAMDSMADNAIEAIENAADMADENAADNAAM